MRNSWLLGVVWLCAGCWADFPANLLNPDRGARDADAGRADADARWDVPDLPGSDAVADAGPDGKIAPPTKSNNSSCTSDGQCFSGVCSADGRCCNLRCDSPCQECATGVCLPILVGKSPRSGTQCSSGATCAADGKCDGFGACRLYTPSGALCVNPGCNTATANQIFLGQVCDGAGKCTAAFGATISCGAYKCSSSSCRSYCGSSSDCMSPATCYNNQCNYEKHQLGITCTADFECQSGFCRDGVCCDADCKEPCRMCNHAAGKGHCVNVPAGMLPPTAPSPAPLKACDYDSLKPCEADGTCDGAGACREAAPKGKHCKTECVVDVAGDYVVYSYCDGAKACARATVKSSLCGKYKCQTGVASCFGRCTETAKHCSAGCNCNLLTSECEGC
jgi:hypothetical protein